MHKLFVACRLAGRQIGANLKKETINFVFEKKLFWEKQLLFFQKEFQQKSVAHNEIFFYEKEFVLKKFKRLFFMTISSPEREAKKVKIAVDRNPVETSFEKWACDLKKG